MSPLKALRTARSSRWIQRIPRFAVGAAWFFILFSLAHLAWVVGVKWGEPAGLTTLYQTTVLTLDGPETYRAWGMAYDGVPGLLLALIQGGVVLGAAVLTLRPGTRASRISHGLLIGWSALWMLNLVNLAGIDGRLDSFVQASFMTLLCGCTVFRALRPPAGRRSPGGTPEAAPLLSDPGPLTSDDVSSSSRVREIAVAVAIGPTSPETPESPNTPDTPPPSRWARGRNAVARAGACGRSAVTLARPIAAKAAKVAKSIGNTGRGVTRKLRDRGVLPRRAPSTST